MNSVSRYILVLLFLIVDNSLLFEQEHPIRLIYPRQDMILSTTDSTLVLGQIQFPNSKLFINNQFVATASDGAFLGYLGIDHDQIGADSSFILACQVTEKDSTYRLDRRVRIPIPPKLFDAAKASIDPNSLEPGDSIWMRPGDRVRIKCRATPGAVVCYDVINSDGMVVDNSLIMSEHEDGKLDVSGESAFGVVKKRERESVGIYSADYTIHSKLKNARIQFLVKKDNDSIRTLAPAVISTMTDADIRVVELANEINNGTVDPDRAYYYFLPKGTRCAVDGRIGSRIRLRLSDHHSAWLPIKNVIDLPIGTTIPKSFIPVVRVMKDGTKSVITLSLSEKIPYRIEQTGERQLQLTLFGGISDTDWIRFDNTDAEITNIRWSQPEDDVYRLTVDLKEPHYWGYETAFDGTNFIWTIRHKPKTKGLRGLKVCIDPGHSKDIGATGPRGVTERQANVEVALALKKELESNGAVVIMTHTDTTQNLTLYDRVAIANDKRCDLFISIHHNALPDGVNPFIQKLGPSVIYYHPQSKKLAESIQPELVKRTKLPDFGIFQGNMAVCRNAQLPAVLVECAFLMVPEQENMIVNPKFQKQVAIAIKNGIKKFIK